MTVDELINRLVEAKKVYGSNTPIALNIPLNFRKFGRVGKDSILLKEFYDELSFSIDRESKEVGYITIKALRVCDNDSL